MAPSKEVCCGSFNIFTLARILTILEFIMSILLFVFIHGAKFSKFGEITWFECVCDTMNMICLGLEYVGIYKKYFGLVLFSCVYRSFCSLLYMLVIISAIIISIRFSTIVFDLRFDIGFDIRMSAWYVVIT